MRRTCWAALVVVSAISAPAGAEELGGRITLKRIFITAPRQRPEAAVDIAADPLRFPPPQLRQAFLDRVEAAIAKEPF